MSYRNAALALWAIFLAVPGFAAEFEAADPDDKETEITKDDEDKPEPPEKVKPPVTPKAQPEKAKDDVEEYGPWQVKVPGDLRGTTYKLRIGDETVDLNKEEITLKGSDFREKVELVDDGGRLMSERTIYVDPYIFDFVSERHWRIGLNFGGASVAGSKMRELLQDDWLSEFSFDFEWQPSAFGLKYSAVTLDSSQEHDPGVTSTFESSQSRLAATYEWVPLKKGNAFLRKFHLLTYAGILSADDTIVIKDDLITLEDESSATGLFVGNDVLFPLWRIWINVRMYASFHEIKFEKFDYEQKAVMHGILIGGSYAF